MAQALQSGRCAWHGGLDEPTEAESQTEDAGGKHVV
jgi:hypothetical protein